VEITDEADRYERTARPKRTADPTWCSRPCSHRVPYLAYLRDTRLRLVESRLYRALWAGRHRRGAASWLGRVSSGSGRLPEFALSARPELSLHSPREARPLRATTTVTVMVHLDMRSPWVLDSIPAWVQTTRSRGAAQGSSRAPGRRNVSRVRRPDLERVGAADARPGAPAAALVYAADAPRGSGSTLAPQETLEQLLTLVGPEDNARQTGACEPIRGRQRSRPEGFVEERQLHDGDL
jgi:hypothetical protein